MGKGLGGGIIPFAAMVCREKYNVAQDISLGHFTHEKSPVACAAAQAVLDFIEQEKLLQKVKEDEVWMKTELHKLKEKTPHHWPGQRNWAPLGSRLTRSYYT